MKRLEGEESFAQPIKDGKFSLSAPTIAVGGSWQQKRTFSFA
jgi:hypothetical protein